jgi:putative ABC transport system permease protein
MTASVAPASTIRPSPIRFSQIRLAFRLALREMRGGFSGFYIFLGCIALGTAAIASVNSVSRSITTSIAAQGQELLSADVRFEIRNTQATPDQLAFFQSLGTLSTSAKLRSMARLPDGSNQALVELKVVDAAYPLYGTLKTEPQAPQTELLKQVDGTYGAIAAPLLLERLGIKQGDTISLGNIKVQIRALLISEPDAVSEGFAFAPRILLSGDALAATGLNQLGSLVDHAYRIKLAQPQTTDVKALSEKAFPDAGWSLRTSANAAPSLTDNIKRFSQFLTLVGLTALIVGGVGVGNAVRAFLESKRGVIATFKCLGAPSFIVTLIYLFQILLVTLVGIAAGLVVGAIAPMIASRLLVGILPVSDVTALYPDALALAALFGLLTALAFAMLPLGRAKAIPATALFRQQGFEITRLPAWPHIVAGVIFLAALAGLAIGTAQEPYIAFVFLGAIAFAFLVLRLVATGVSWLAKHSPKVHSPALRLAIGNIHRPGALTHSVVLSLGLGLTLLVALALIDGNLRSELTGSLPERAPNFFFVDVQGKDIDQFRTVLKQQSPEGKIVEVPMLRGRILKFNDIAVSELNVPQGGRWVLQGDRGITYADGLPANATLVEGTWWDKNYSGEPLMSFSADEARELGLKLGDRVTVSVLGRTITAKIANFRKVEWGSLSINFVMVFSPNTFKGAPHAWLATLTDAKATPASEAATLKAITNAFPTITSVRVKDALDIVNTLVAQLAAAIRAAAAVALIASVLVLSGALAAGNRARVHDAVVLKTLGATRRTLITAFTLEYMLLGLATGIFALVSGGVAAWYVISQIMKLPYAFLPDVALITLLLALVLTIGIGLAGTWRILGMKAAPVLREL